MRATLFYTALRLLVFAVVAVALYFAGARGLLLLALAVLISGFLSFVALSRQRDAMSAAITRRMSRVREGLDAAARAEDEESDRAAGAAGGPDAVAPRGGPRPD